MSGWFDRTFVDRHVYERRARGGQVVTFTRRAQLGMACAAAFLLLLTVGLGASTAYLWLARHGGFPELAGERPVGSADGAPTRSLPDSSGTAPAGSVGASDPASAEAAALRARLAQSAAEGARLAESLRQAQARLAAFETPSSAPPADASAPGVTPGQDVGLELAIVLRERDAARQQVESLMASAAKLRAELDRVEAGIGGGAAAPAAAGPARRPLQAPDEALRADLQLAVERLRTLDPALAAQLDQDLSARQPPAPGAPAPEAR